MISELTTSSRVHRLSYVNVFIHTYMTAVCLESGAKWNITARTFYRFVGRFVLTIHVVRQSLSDVTTRYSVWDAYF